MLAEHQAVCAFAVFEGVNAGGVAICADTLLEAVSAFICAVSADSIQEAVSASKGADGADARFKTVRNSLTAGETNRVCVVRDMTAGGKGVA